MSRYTLIFLVAVALVCIAQANPIQRPPKCKAHEVFSRCGSMCEKTCMDKEPKMCAAVCIAGCVCQEGMLRNEDGKCVYPCDC